MAPTVSIGGVHLINSTGAPVAGGVATAAATTPFALGASEVLANAAPTVYYSGGAPFTLGARPVAYGYDNVRQTWRCMVAGGSGATPHETAVASLQTLKQTIQRALFDTAAVLAIQPTSSSTIMYAEVYDANIQELPSSDGLIPLTGQSDIEFELTFTRSPFFTPSGLTTLINGATFTNTGTGANNNTQSLGTVVGDLIYEGQPLNIKIVPAAASLPQAYFMATVYQRTYTASVATATTTTSAQAFRDTTSGITNPARTRNGLRGRVLLRVTALSAKAQLQVFLVSHVTNDIVWRGPVIQQGVVTGAIASAAQIDLTPQGIPFDAIRRAQLTSGDVDVAVFVYSQDGTSVTCTTHSMETLLYYTFCKVIAGKAIVGTTEYLRVEQAQNLNGTAYFAAPGAAFVADLSGSEYMSLACDVRGTLPLAISGASLYLSWVASDPLHVNTQTAAVTVTHLPLWRTFRGA